MLEDPNADAARVAEVHERVVAPEIGRMRGLVARTQVGRRCDDDAFGVGDRKRDQRSAVGTRQSGANGDVDGFGNEIDRMVFEPEIVHAWRGGRLHPPQVAAV